MWVQASYIGNSFKVAVDIRVVDKRGGSMHSKKLGPMAIVSEESKGGARNDL